MALDASIPLGVRAPNLGQLGQAFMESRDFRDRANANRLQQTLVGLQVASAQDEAKYKKTLNGLLQLNMTEGPDGLKLDEEQTVRDLSRLGFGQRALGLQGEFRKNRADAAAQKRQQYLDRLDLRSRILDGATEADYDSRLKRLRALGDDLDGIPSKFDAQAVQGHLNEVLTRKEKLEQMGKEAKALADKTAAEFEQGAKFNETKRHNQAMEQVGMAQAEATRANSNMANAQGTLIPGYRPTAGMVIKPENVKMARDAAFTKQKLDNLLGQFRDIYLGPVGADGKRVGGSGIEVTGPRAQKMQSIAQEILLAIKEAENLGVLQKIDVEALEPLVPKAGLKQGLKQAVNIYDPKTASDFFEGYINRTLGGKIKLAGFEPDGAQAPSGGASGAPVTPQGRLVPGANGVFIYERGGR